MRINLFYPFVVMVGIALYFLLQPPEQTELNFFGFAESNETAVNYNYPVVVDRLLVQPGASVKKGQPLLEVSRRKSKEVLADQEYRIAELRAEQQLWLQRKRDELGEMSLKGDDRRAELAAQLRDLEEELSYKKSLSVGLATIKQTEADYQPLENRIERVKAELARAELASAEASSRIRREINLGLNPFKEQIKRLEAEMSFDQQQQVIPFTVPAPADGLIGNINVREQEHVQSYTTLLTFYAPHSDIVRGYVHEDLTMKVEVGDSLEVYSLKVPGMSYTGLVTGLGSRIVETPTRLRKLPEFKTYGREVILSIPEENGFLQKEKVGLRSKE